MNKRIMIIESDQDFLKKFNDFFNSIDNYEIVGSMTDGANAFQLIRNLKPDVLILGSVMPDGKNFSILERLECKKDTKIIVVSSTNDETFISKILALGVDSYMLKPLSFPNLKMRIDEMLAPQISTAMLPALLIKTNIEEKITNIFITLGIPAHISGFHFLREAVKIAIGNYNIVNKITKGLYPEVATRFGTNPYKVERGIRHAIEVAWNKGKIININSIFGLSVYDNNEKPSNAELIALLADKMHFIINNADIGELTKPTIA